MNYSWSRSPGSPVALGDGLRAAETHSSWVFLLQPSAIKTTLVTTSVLSLVTTTPLSPALGRLPTAGSGTCFLCRVGAAGLWCECRVGIVASWVRAPPGNRNLLGPRTLRHSPGPSQLLDSLKKNSSHQRLSTAPMELCSPHLLSETSRRIRGRRQGPSKRPYGDVHPDRSQSWWRLKW